LYLGYYCIGLTFVLEVLSWIDKGGDCQSHVFWYCQPCQIVCLKAVLEDQVDDIKFAIKKLKKNTFSPCTLVAARYLSIEARNLLHPRYKVNTSSNYWNFALDTSSIVARSIKLCGLAKSTTLKNS